MLLFGLVILAFTFSWGAPLLSEGALGAAWAAFLTVPAALGLTLVGAGLRRHAVAVVVGEPLVYISPSPLRAGSPLRADVEIVPRRDARLVDGSVEIVACRRSRDASDGSAQVEELYWGSQALRPQRLRAGEKAELSATLNVPAEIPGVRFPAGLDWSVRVTLSFRGLPTYSAEYSEW